MIRYLWIGSATPPDATPSGVIAPDYGSARCGLGGLQPDQPLQPGLPRGEHLVSRWLDAQRARADRPAE
jgi:hypothetical protein